MKIAISGRDYLIVTRQSKGKKSNVFLLQVQPDGKRKYISSLWVRSASVYAFEYNGVRYDLNTENRTITKQNG